MKYYSALKRKAILPQATPWMNPEDEMLSEMPVTEGPMLCDPTYARYPEEPTSENIGWWLPGKSTDAELLLGSILGLACAATA